LLLIPVSAITIDPLIANYTQVQVLWPRGLERTQHFAAGILWALVPFYPASGTTPHGGDLVAGLISYVTCILPADEVMGMQEMTEALNYAGLAPQWRDMTPQNIADFQNERTLQLVRMFSTSSQHLLLHDRNQQVGLAGLLLLLIGKSVTTAGYEGWVNNRLRTFRGVLGIPEDNFIWVLKTTPHQRVLATLSTYLSANQPLRTRLFHVCFRAASSRISVISQIFSTVVRLLRGVEMNHILLIDYFIFTKYPELLRIRPVRDNMSRFNQAIAYLATIPDGDACCPSAGIRT
jgi:hypothetical protein